MLLTRRALTGALSAGVLIGLWPARARHAAAQEATVPEDRIFDVLLKGTRIGQHAVTFTPEGDGFRANTRLELRVKLAFITLVDLRHESRELWQAGRLMELASVTNDGDDLFEVTAAATKDGIRVESESGPIIAPPHIRTSNTIWDPRCMLQHELIDAQNGGVIGLVAEPLGEEHVEVAGRQMSAMRYRGITPNAAGQLWYAGDELVKVQLEVRGETVDYQLVA
jgi:Family of unknown function (DUF6134)